jgi:hypothetical protein
LAADFGFATRAFFALPFDAAGATAFGDPGAGATSAMIRGLRAEKLKKAWVEWAR